VRTESDFVKDPIVIVNFKTYAEVEGEKCLALARICDKVASENGVSIGIAPPLIELSKIASEVEIPVFSQHIDIRKSDPRTGHVTLRSIKAAGCAGTLLNHSERRLILADLEDLISGAKENRLITIVCTNNTGTSRAVAPLEPDYIAMEPPELIGGDISVTTANPGIVQDAVKAVKDISKDVKVLTGAGVKTSADLKKALELGCAGVLLASGVVKAKDPKAALISLCSGITTL
jgi:triosephosphate isomerase